MNAPIPLTHARLVEVLRYEPETGEFFWRVRKAVWQTVGDRAGTDGQKGYRLIRVDHKTYRAARLAWFYVHGEYPSLEMDHRNGVRHDDRIENLRLATRSQNNANRRSLPPASGFKGVHPNNGGWAAAISKDKRLTHLGTYRTKEEAHAAYVAAAKRLHGEFARSK